MMRTASHTLAMTMLLLAQTVVAQDATQQPALFLRPHCELPQQESCPAFDVADPLTLRTLPLKANDILDLDVVLWNPGQEKVEKTKIWLSYDSGILEGVAISATEDFPTVTPGEDTFAPEAGHAKIAAASTTGSEPQDVILPLARVVFRVKVANASTTSPIAFHDRKDDLTGHTYVTTVSASDRNAIPDPLSTLMVAFAAGGSASSATPVSSASSVSSISSASSQSISSVAPVPSVTSFSSASLASLASLASSSVAPIAVSLTSSSAASVASSSSQPSQPSVFESVQIQNVRVSTQDSGLHVTWDPLSHPKLQGYIVYYGTQPGRYLQRRSVGVASRGTVIHDLPTGTTYYVIVRGIDDNNRETTFSKEQSVEIGNPSTSTAPITEPLSDLSLVSPQATAPENPLGPEDESAPATVPGSTGVGSALAVLVMIAAAAGTLLAARRQWIALPRLP